MQPRFVSTLLAASALAAALSLASAAWSQTDVITVDSTGVGETAAETEHDKHVFVNNATANAPAGRAGAGDVDAPAQADPLTDGLILMRYMATPEEAAVGSANGGVWKTTDGGAAESAPDRVSNGEGPQQTDGLLVIRHMFGLRGSPATAEQSVQANGTEQAGMLLPAVQKVREAAQRTNGNPSGDGVVLLNQAQEGRTGTGTLTLSGSSPPAAPNDPEPPVCGSCSADAQAQPQQQQAEAEQPRRRPNFSISIGGVTVGTGGVNVAVGDVNGDGRESSSSSSRRTSSSSSAPGRRR